MTFDRSNMRTSRKARFDVESLGERIVPTHLGVIGAGGHVHLNLVEKLGPAKPFNFHRHHHVNPIIVTAPVTFNAVSIPTKSPLPGKLPKNNPIVVTAPVTFNAVSIPTNSPLPGNLPKNNPIVVTAPVTFTGVPTPKLPAPKIMPDNISTPLVTIYEQYEQNPAAFTGVTSSTDGANLVVVQADKVGITVHDNNPSEFDGLMSELKQAGMTNVISSTTYGTVTGMLPIAELVTIANYSNNLNVNPEFAAIML